MLQRLASKGTPSTPRAAARPEPAAADSPFEKAVAELARAHRAGDQELVELLRLELVEMLEPVLKERGQSADDFLRQIDEVLARDARDSD